VTPEGVAFKFVTYRHI